MNRNLFKTKNQNFSATFVTIILSVIFVHLTVTYVLYNKLNDSMSQYEKSVATNIEMDKIWLKRFEPIYIELPRSAKIRAIKENYEKSNSLWFFVDKKVATPQDYIPDNLIISQLRSAGTIYVKQIVVEDLIKMFQDAENSGIFLKIGSGYRSYEYQKNLFNTNAALYGADIANQTIAMPGHSEHQLGLAIDIVSTSGNCYIEECFQNLKEGVWLATNAHNYGFILRYPKGKESITGYSYEPWHFRYLGKDLATALYNSGLTFDESQIYIKKALSRLKLNQTKLAN